MGRSVSVRVDRIAPSDDDFGWVVCRVCGLQWLTTPEQDELLADLFDHDATHGPGAVVGPPTS